MEIIILLIISGGLVFLGIGASFFFNPEKKLKKIFDELSRDFKMKSTSIQLSPEIEVNGKIGGHNFEINQFPGGYQAGGMNVYVENPFKHLGAFSIRSMNSRDSIGIPLHKDDILCGDKIFDNHFFLLASHQYWLLGKLSHRCRGYFMELAGLVLIELVSDQVIKLKINREPLNSLKDRLSYTIKLILKIINHFNNSTNSDSELLQNCLSDPEALVRAANLKELFYNHSLNFDMEKTLEKCLNDKSWDVKLTAAEFSGKKGMTVIYEALEHTDPGINTLAVDSLDRMGFKALDKASEMMLKDLKNYKSIELLVTLFAKWPRRNTISLLHHWLLTGTDLIKIQCLKILKKCGIIEDISVVRSMVNHTNSSQLQKQAEETIKAIISHTPDSGLGGALSQTDKFENGQLSLDSSHNGQLSETE